jgi:hypothetical protein
MDEKQITILWGYKQKEEDIFYQRSNFFLVAEAMLFTAWATLAAATTHLAVQEYTISALGVVLGIVWIYVSGRQINVIAQISSEASRVIEIYKKIRDERHAAPFSSTKALAYFVPVAVIAAWVVLSISRLCVR